MVPRRHAGQWIAAGLLLVLAAALAHTVLTNARFGWPTVRDYLFDQQILAGVLLTLELTVVSMAVGVLLGMLLAVLRLSGNPLLSGGAALYIWFFRATPVLVQLLFWFNLSALFPTVSLGIPFGPTLVEGSANSIISPLTAAFLGLALNEAAYMAEIVRAGITSVDVGQTEAALSLGLTRGAALRKVVLPQAMRVIIPPTGNEVISMLKNTSLVSVLAIADLLYSAQIIYAANYRTIPLLIVATLWYLVLTSALSLVQSRVERHYGRGHAGSDIARPLLRRTARQP